MFINSTIFVYSSKTWLSNFLVPSSLLTDRSYTSRCLIFKHDNRNIHADLTLFGNTVVVLHSAELFHATLSLLATKNVEHGGTSRVMMKIVVQLPYFPHVQKYPHLKLSISSFKIKFYMTKRVRKRYKNKTIFFCKTCEYFENIMERSSNVFFCLKVEISVRFETDSIQIFFSIVQNLTNPEFGNVWKTLTVSFVSFW